MNHTMDRIRSLLYTLGIAAALAFGATEAFSEPRACADPNADGACVSNRDCQELVCGGAAGGCSRGCCYCEFSPAG